MFQNKRNGIKNKKIYLNFEKSVLGNMSQPYKDTFKHRVVGLDKSYLMLLLDLKLVVLLESYYIFFGKNRQNVKPVRDL